MTGTESILVIEDDDNLRFTVGETLEDAGYQVSLAAGAAEALSLARQHRFHLVLSDVRMAGSLDGVGAVEEIKKRQPYVRSIIMTGYASTEVPLRAARLQADDYLLKGDNWFGVAELLRVVRRTLDREERGEPGWLGRLLSLPGQIARSLFEARLADLERERKALLKTVFLLIRPGHLSANAAWTGWERLEQLELEFYQLSSTGEIPRLREAYGALQKWFESPPRGAERQSQENAPPIFMSFYQKVRQGQVELPQFERAPRLRLDPEARRENAQVYALYHWLWGEVRDCDLDGFTGLAVGGYVLRELLLDTDRIQGVRSYRATRADSPKPVLVRVLPNDSQARSSLGSAQAIEAKGALFFIQDWPWPVPGEPTTYRRLLVLGGMSFPKVWVLMRPVFAEVVEQHRQGRFSGCLTPDDVVTEPDGRLCVDFPIRRRGPSAGNIINIFHAAFHPPEYPSGTCSASDQFCLATFLVFFLLGEPSGTNFMLHCGHAQVGKGSLLPNPALTPASQRLEVILQRLRHPDPLQRAPSVADAIPALDAVAQRWT